MSKKNLLNETQVRKFMKLASLEPLTPGFVGGLTEKAYVNESDDELDERRQTRPPGGGPGGGGTSHGRSSETMPDTDLMREEEEVEGEMELDADLGGEEEGEMELDADLGGEEDVEMDVEEPADDMGDAGRTVDVDDFLAALETALEDVMDDEVEIDSDEMEDVEVEDDVEEPVADVEDDVEVADVEVEDEEELMERVARRVRKRISTMKRQNTLAETVTKRVAARILKEALQTRPKRPSRRRARKVTRRTKK